MDIPKLNGSQRAILDLVKYRGGGTVPGLADALDLNVETVRGHVKGLVAEELLRREGTVREGPGRPEIVYRLTPAAERLFPRREAELLRRLAEHLRRSGHQPMLDGFFDEWIAEHRAEAMTRVANLSGRERLDEVASILSELGFMAIVDEGNGAREAREAVNGARGSDPRLRLCHCPMRALVDATRTPCRAEVGLVGELLGRELVRESYIPAGDASCSYRIGPDRAIGAESDGAGLRTPVRSGR